MKESGKSVLSVLLDDDKLFLCNCYIIAEWSFFLLSFFVGFILSFGLVRLRTIRLSVRAGTHIERRCSCSRGEDVTITNVIIKAPDRKLNWGANDVMLGSDGLGFLVILRKSGYLRFGPGWVQLGLRDVPRVCWVCELRFEAGRGESSGATGCAAGLLGKMERSA